MRRLLANIPLALCLFSGILLFSLMGCHRDPQKVHAQAIERADRYMEQGKVDSAIIEYKNALKALPKSETANLKLGEAYLKNSQIQEAYEQFTKVLVISPKNREARLALGQIFLQAGVLEDASQMAMGLLVEDSKDIDARLLMANIRAAQHMVPQAILDLETLAAEHPELIGVHINLGVLYASAGKKDQARAELQRAVSLAPSSFDAKKALAAFYVSTGNAAEAEQLYRSAATGAPDSTNAQLTLAQFLIAQNRSAEAEQIYKSLVQLQNNSPQSRFALASFYVKQQRYADARKLDEQIVHDNDFFQARLQLAELALNSGDLAYADSCLTELRKNPDHKSDVHLLQARVLVAERKPQQAIELLEPLLQHENSALTHYLLGVAYGQLGNLQRSDGEMQSAISVDAHFLDAYIYLAKMMLDRGQPKSSLQYSRLALQQAPNRPDVVLLVGNAYAKMGDLASAEKNFQLVAKTLPQSSEPVKRIAFLRSYQKRNADAVALFEKALQLNPHDYEALDGLIGTLILNHENEKAVLRIHAELARQETAEALNIAGKAMLELGDLTSAEEYLKKALERSHDNYSSYVLLGVLYARKKQVPEAIQYYQSALKVHGNDVSLLIMLGMLYQNTGDVKSAMEAYNRAISIEPDSGVVANNLAWIYADNLGDMDKALEFARRAKVSLPNVPNVSDTLGWIYCRRQLNEMAIPLLREATKADPKNADYHFHLAVALQHNGHKSEAHQELITAVKFNANLRQRDAAQEILQSR